MKKILFLFLFLLVVSSCKKDESDIVSPGNEYTPKIITETYGTAKLVGFVKDKSGNPLAGVTVFFGEEKALTGSDGGYQLNTLSAGTKKRIWFQKSGYASTQKLADIKEELPNRIDASLFLIDKAAKITSDGGKIEGKDFSVEIKPGGFVYSDGRSVEEDVTAEVTAFLTSENEFLDAFPGEFRGTRENGTETAIESFGFIDVVLKVKSGEPVQLADGVTAIIKIKAPQNSPATIPMWHYDEDIAKWTEEGVGKLDNGLYTAEVSHFTKWNWDRPIELRSKIVGRVIDNSGNPIEGASVVQKGITYRFQNSDKTNEKGEFELLTPESNETQLEAQFDFYGSTIINYTTSPNKGQVNNIGDIKIDVSIENVIAPLISNNVLYITIGQTAKIRGQYFGEQKIQGYKLLLNGNEVATKTWKNDLIEFDVPYGITEEGTIQIDRDGILSREVDYIEGEWTCEINRIIYDNNSLPIIEGKFHLNLYLKDLVVLPNCISNLQNLQELDLEGNSLFSLPTTLSKLKNLEGLHLFRNEIRSLPENFSNLLNLSNLDIRSNKLYILPENFSSLKNLETLWLDDNLLSSLPKNFGNLLSLKVLWLERNKFTNLPEDVGDLQSLKELRLRGNGLISLPENFGNLKNLEELDLQENKFKTLPENFSDLKKLRKLILNHNKFIVFSESFSNLQSLELLYLEGNQLTTLPESFGNLQSLKRLYLYNNLINSLPESFGNLKNLEILKITHNKLSNLPDNFSNLQNLQELYLSVNQFFTLPESIGKLQKLEVVELVDNQLTTLPESLGNLVNLEKLWLNDNQLTTLPESFGKLVNLKGLFLNGNKLSSLPESIKNLKDSLTDLDITGNNFSKEEKAKLKEWLPNTNIRW